MGIYVKSKRIRAIYKYLDEADFNGISQLKIEEKTGLDKDTVHK